MQNLRIIGAGGDGGGECGNWIGGRGDGDSGAGGDCGGAGGGAGAFPNWSIMFLII